MPAASPRAANSSADAATSTVKARTRCVEAVAPDILGGDCGKLRIDLDQRDFDAGHAHRERQPGGANARAEVNRAVAGARGGRSRQQDGIVADAMAAPLLLEPQPAAEHGIVGQLRLERARTQFMGEASISQQLAGDVLMLVVHQNAPRQDAERAFQHAHVAVEHHMRNFRALEQRFDRGDQHRVVGADELAHRSFKP